MMTQSEGFKNINEYLSQHYAFHRANIMKLLAKALKVNAYEQAGQWIIEQVVSDSIQSKILKGGLGAWLAEIAGLLLALPALTYEFLKKLYNESQLRPDTKTNPYSPHDNEQAYVAFIVFSWGRQGEPYYQTLVTFANPSYSCQSKH